MRLTEPTGLCLKPGTNVLALSLDDFSSYTLLFCRSYHVLKRAGFRIVADLLNPTTKEEILGIRNMTVKCARNIAENLHALGIWDTVWDSFLEEV